MSEVIWRDIYGLYSEGWGRDKLCEDAFAHPAKVRPALAREIFRHGIAAGFWPLGSVLVDPFAGIGGFLLTGAWAGLRMVGVELERRFWQMAGGCDCSGVTKAQWVRYFARGQQDKIIYRDGKDICPECRGGLPYKGNGMIPCSEAHRYGGNVGLHAAGWDASHPRPVIINGDSQDLRRLVMEAVGGASSPPYAAIAPGQGGFNSLPPRPGTNDETGRRFAPSQANLNVGTTSYGSTPGNLGNMPSGGCASPPFGSSDSAGPESLHRRKDATAAKMLKCQGWHGGGQESAGNLAQMPMAGGVASPPYVAIAPGQGGLNTLPPREGHGDQTGRAAGPSQVITGGASSPPYEESLQNPGGSRTPGAPEGFKLGRSTAGVVSSPPFQGVTATQDPDFLTPGERGKTVPSKSNDASYGNTPGQLGGMPSGSASSSKTKGNRDDSSAICEMERKGMRRVRGTVDSPQGRPSAATQQPRMESVQARRALPLSPRDNLPGLALSGDSMPALGRRTRREARELQARSGLASISWGDSQRQVSNLRIDQKVGDSPQEPRSLRQPPREPGSPVQLMPLEPEQEGLVESQEGGAAPSCEQLSAGLGPENERGTTFWDALKIILQQQRSILSEGAVCAWVVKSFVRNKALVNFPDQCADLINATGYEVFERWRCWQVSKAKVTDMFTGDVKALREFKGFFRRLAESKQSPRVDFEETIWFRAVPFAPPPERLES